MKQRPLLIVGLAVLLVAVACSSGETRPSTPTTASAPPAEERPLRVSLVDEVWDLITAGKSPSAATLQVLESQLSEGIEGELTTLLIQADIAIQQGAPEAERLSELIAGLLPSPEQLATIEMLNAASGDSIVALGPSGGGGAGTTPDPECAQLWTAGRSDLFTSSSAPKVLECLELTTTAAGGTTLRVLIPKGFDATNFRKWATDAAKDSMGRLSALDGGLQPVVVLYDPRPQYGDDGDETYAWAWDSGSGPCYVVFPANLDDSTAAQYRFTMEHEITHCYQFAHLRSQMYRGANVVDWWVEGGAEYVAVISHGTAVAETTSPLDESVFSQTYDNWQFWDYITDDAQDAVNLWKTIPSSGAGDEAWFGALEGIDELFHEFAVAGLDGSLPLGVATTDSVVVKLSESQEATVSVPTGFAVVADFEVTDVLDDAETRAAVELQVSIEGPGLLSWWDGSTADRLDQDTNFIREFGCNEDLPDLLITSSSDTEVRVSVQRIGSPAAAGCDDAEKCTIALPDGTLVDLGDLVVPPVGSWMSIDQAKALFQYPLGCAIVWPQAFDRIACAAGTFYSSSTDGMSINVSVWEEIDDTTRGWVDGRQPEKHQQFWESAFGSLDDPPHSAVRILNAGESGPTSHSSYEWLSYVTVIDDATGDYLSTGEVAYEIGHGAIYTEIVDLAPLTGDPWLLEITVRHKDFYAAGSLRGDRTEWAQCILEFQGPHALAPSVGPDFGTVVHTGVGNWEEQERYAAQLIDFVIDGLISHIADK